MKLGVVARARVLGARPLVRAILASAPLRALLASRRRDAVVNRGLDEHLAAVLGLDDLSRDSHYWRWTPARARERMREGVAIADDAPQGALHVRDLPLAGPAGDVPARFYEPPELPAPSPGLVYLHGGGWVVGDLDTHDALCRRFALEGRLRVVSVAMRLAPEHRWPAALDDSVASYRAVVARAAELGLDRGRIGVGGDSAGGNLSALVALETRRDACPPALQVLLYPALDLTWSAPSHVELVDGYMLNRRVIDWYDGHWLGGRNELRTDPRVSPQFAPSLAGVAPALVVVAGFDPLRDEALTYADRLEAAGVVVERQVHGSLIHGFALMTGVSPAGRDATSLLARRTGELLRGGVEAGQAPPA